VAAFKAGTTVLDMGSDAEMPDVENWIVALDKALPKLDKLKSTEKETLVRALTVVVMHDGQLQPTELELLRVTCDLIHVPIPLLSSTSVS
jgi:hypothetical protein